jgi:branched-chain amino acid aminotransferase
MNPSKHIWLNGKFLKWDEANTHVLTHALHYGSGVFEGIRAYKTDHGTAIFKAKEHYSRLLASCETYSIKCIYSINDLINATKELITINNLPSCYIRPIVYTDYGSIGIIPKEPNYSVAIAVWEWGTYLGEDGIKNGIRCIISNIMKTPSQSMPATAKSCANYANSFLAKKLAIKEGYDEAILLNQYGNVSEGPGENIFIINKKNLITPPLSDDVLNGVTRSTIIKLARDYGFTVKEESFKQDQLMDADECFFTGTAAEVTPIREINKHHIGSGTKGPITSILQSAYFDVVKGRNSKYMSWLTHCGGNFVKS